jgi:hypothetical protein
MSSTRIWKVIETYSGKKLLRKLKHLTLSPRLLFDILRERENDEVLRYFWRLDEVVMDRKTGLCHEKRDLALT